MRLHLIRHGQTDWNAVRRIQGQSESRLDDVGKAQASDLGGRLEAVSFRSAWVSSARRTRETAERLLAGRSVPIRFRDDLREMRLGRWETRMWADVEASEPAMVALYRDFDEGFEVEGAESLALMQQRGVDAIADIVAREIDEGAGEQDDVAIVSHGFLLRAILAELLARPLTDFSGLPGLPNCAHSIVEYSTDGTPRVVTIDSSPPGSGLWSALRPASSSPDAS